MTQQRPQTDRESAILEGMDEASMLELLRKEADLIDIRFSDEFKVCNYRLNNLLIEVKQDRRHLEKIFVSITGASLR